jgi:hypothetical protein
LCDPAIHVVFQFQLIIQPLVISIGEFFIVFITQFVIEHFVVVFIITVVLLFFIHVGILPISRQPERFAILQSVLCRPAFNQSVRQHPNRECKQRFRWIARNTGRSTICFR